MMSSGPLLIRILASRKPCGFSALDEPPPSLESGDLLSGGESEFETGSFGSPDEIRAQDPAVNRDRPAVSPW